MDPVSLIYRSPVYRKLQELGAEFREINGYAVPSTVGDLAAQSAAVAQLALCDLSGLPRIGVKGLHAANWLSEEGFIIPADNNSARRQDDGALLVRLAPNEFLVLGEEARPYPCIEKLAKGDKFPSKSSGLEKPFLVPRQYSQIWFRLIGGQGIDTLAKLCAIDFRASSANDFQIAQTSLARLNAIVIRDDLDGIPGFHILADTASAEYLWDCLIDAGAEHSIRVVGLKVLAELKQG